MALIETKDEKVKRLCQKLKPVIGPRIDQIWQMYLIEDEKGKSQLEEYLKLLAATAITDKGAKWGQISTCYMRSLSSSYANCYVECRDLTPSASS